MSTFALFNGSNRPSAFEAPETPVVTIGSLAMLRYDLMMHEIEIDARCQISAIWLIVDVQVTVTDLLRLIAELTAKLIMIDYWEGQVRYIYIRGQRSLGIPQEGQSKPLSVEVELDPSAELGYG